ncbi:6-phosphogluconolactonase [Buchnera aphidicola (Hyadaphis tataricae)]|uniref:6-phosphogluconolactonase n=1 Tax=Buchnera aphidicola (Hyadaphis tataricae) TaxID=1241859 RepID=A0A4D6XYI9_9GAMM|nr:6-phosphogluconolactonase [Buchnera aphidicola]QCI21593.1 6-phosphogluconolactonase [Buchnera aphidicola (Hyadaphis tataricae)]
MKQVVYIANSTIKTIETWDLSDNGNMNLIDKTFTDGEVQPINIIKHHNILYAGIRSDNKIIAYLIKTNGFLEKQNEISIPGAPNHISFDKNKKFLFCSSYHSNCITVIPLKTDGTLKKPIQIIQNIKGCHAAKMSYKHNILFVMSLKEDCIYLYDLTTFGILKNTAQISIKTKPNSGPRHLVIHPNQDFFYTINELDGTIDVWNIQNINDKKHVQKIQNINIFDRSKTALKNYWSADVHITSCGRFLYASDRFCNTISLFYIDKNNKITFFTSYQTEVQPRSFCIDVNNSYLIVAGEKSNTFTIYDIQNTTGELNKIKTYNTGTRPVWIMTHQLN